jgi:hypothetical protein
MHHHTADVHMRLYPGKGRSQSDSTVVCSGDTAPLRFVAWVPVDEQALVLAVSLIMSQSCEGFQETCFLTLQDVVQDFPSAIVRQYANLAPNIF